MTRRGSLQLNGIPGVSVTENPLSLCHSLHFSLFALLFVLFLDMVFFSFCRSRLLVVRMLSTGQIRWCLWAPLVLLALVSHFPSKAQGQGKYFFPFSLCFSPSHPLLSLFPSFLFTSYSTIPTLAIEPHPCSPHHSSLLTFPQAFALTSPTFSISISFSLSSADLSVSSPPP